IKIYTKTGDKGKSSLFNGERREKDDIVFEALGTTDELSSILGLAREYCQEENNGLNEPLKKIQSTLLDIGAHIATPRNNTIHEKRIELTKFDQENNLVKEMEQHIDQLSADLPPLKNFILPSGGKASSTLHIARSLTRRAERRVIPLIKEGQVDNNIGIYLNRLSDYFFVMARYSAHLGKYQELIYTKRG
ncbi:hypothetical protein K502DRAFT_293790, partial [Neoconidiobolus thromboides FSU 785]